MAVDDAFSVVEDTARRLTAAQLVGNDTTRIWPTVTPASVAPGEMAERGDRSICEQHCRYCRGLRQFQHFIELVQRPFRVV